MDQRNLLFIGTRIAGIAAKGKTMAVGGTKVKKVKAFWWLLGITLTYFAIYYLLIMETKACIPAIDGVFIQDHWFHGFWDRYLGCRSINELGDALAGAFAPVAFLWLAGAVLIQSKELEAQREELNETQEVMRLQLAVSEQQVKETKASTALFQKQTDILEQEQKLRERQLADQEFDKRIEAFLVTLERVSGGIWYQAKNPKVVSPGLIEAGTGTRYPVQSRPDGMAKTCSQLLVTTKETVPILRRTLAEYEEIAFGPDIVAHIETLLTLMREILRTVPSLSAAHQHLANSFELGILIEQLEAMKLEIVSIMQERP